jgi:selenide,water dikinase
MMFPAGKLPVEAYSGILRGGADKASEAGLRIIGGHTIDDFPPKYGLAVVGYVHPGKVITNSGAREGDLLILTKPVGTGIILAGQKLKIASDDDIDEAKSWMKLLNDRGAQVMSGFGIRGATDVTGFGLAGHALKMAKASNVTLEIDTDSVPLIGNTYNLADEGCIPGACFRNLVFVENDSLLRMDLNYNLKMIAMDAQTSGGLLMSVDRSIADAVLDRLHEAGLPKASVIGSVTARKEKYLYLT